MTTKPGWMPRFQKPSMGTLLLSGSAIYQAAQYSKVALLMDGTAGSLDFGPVRLPVGQIGAMIGGAVINFSLVYVANQLPKTTGKVRVRWVTAGFVCLLILSPAILAPAHYQTMQRTLFDGNGIAQAIWAFGWSLAVDVAIAVVGMVDKRLVALTSETSATPATSEAAASDQQAKPAKGKRSKLAETAASATPATNEAAASDQQADNKAAIPAASETPAKEWFCECDPDKKNPFTNPKKFSGHQGKCKAHQAARAIPAGQPFVAAVSQGK